MGENKHRYASDPLGFWKEMRNTMQKQCPYIITHFYPMLLQVFLPFAGANVYGFL